MPHDSTKQYGEGVTAINQVHHAPIAGHPSTAGYRPSEPPQPEEELKEPEVVQALPPEPQEIAIVEPVEPAPAASAETLQPGGIVEIDSVNSINPAPAKEETDAITD